jgi:hypothetical protein
MSPLDMCDSDSVSKITMVRASNLKENEVVD